MGSWIKCRCGAAVHTNPHAGAPVYWLIRDTDYESLLNDNIDWKKTSDIFLEKGISVYRCSECNRLIVEWEKQKAPVYYLPEDGNTARAPGIIKRFFRKFSFFQFFLIAILFMIPPSFAGSDQAGQLDAAWDAEEKGDLDEAIDRFSAIIRSSTLDDSERASALNGRGIAYRLKGRHDDAIADYSKAIELQRDFTAAYSNRGLAYAKSGRYQNAIPDFDRAIELDPRNAMTYLKRGSAYFDKSNIASAIKDWSIAISIKPDLMRAYYNRCDAYDRIGETALALKDCEKVLELEPGFQPARVALEWIRGSRNGPRPCFCNY
jgi:tetratricopeptide (TPR) repeat protein